MNVNCENKKFNENVHEILQNFLFSMFSAEDMNIIF